MGKDPFASALDGRKFCPPADDQLVEGPCYGYDAAAKYLEVSQRQVRVFEEQGVLVFFKLGPKMKKTTKGELDGLISRSLQAYLAELEDPQK